MVRHNLSAKLPELLNYIAESIKDGKKIFILQGDLEELITFNLRYQTVAHWIQEMLPNCSVIQITNTSEEGIEGIFEESTSNPLLIVAAHLIFSRNIDERISKISQVNNDPKYKPIFLHFPYGMPIPEELNSSWININLVQINHNVTSNHEKIINNFLQQKHFVIDLEEINDLTIGMSPKEMLICFESSYRKELKLDFRSILKSRIELIKEKYKFLGNVKEVDIKLSDSYLSGELRDEILQTFNFYKKNKINKPLVFYGDGAEDIAIAFSNDVGNICFQINYFGFEDYKELRRKIELLLVLIRTQGRITLLLGPLENIFSIEHSKNYSLFPYLLNRLENIINNIHQINPHCLIIGFTDTPSVLAERTHQLFINRVAISPIRNKNEVESILKSKILKKELDIPSFPEDKLPISRMQLKLLVTQINLLVENELEIEDSIYQNVSKLTRTIEEYEYARVWTASLKTN